MSVNKGGGMVRHRINILERIENARHYLNPALRRIAEYILTSPAEVKLLNIGTLPEPAAFQKPRNEICEGNGSQ